MSAFFESALLFSLAILIVLVGLLVYYFKDRLIDLEQKNNQCLDIIKDVYTAHSELKTTVENMMIPAVRVGGNNVWSEPHYEDNEDDSESESESESESDDDESVNPIQMTISDYDMGAIKTITLDPEEMQIMEDDIPDNGTDMPEEYDITDDVEPTYEEPTYEEPKMVINKLDLEESLANDDLTSTINDDITSTTDKTSYKKMNLTELRAYIVANGICTDNARLKHMKKQELIDMINAV
jgi:hypothetical protein